MLMLAEGLENVVQSVVGGYCLVMFKKPDAIGLLR